MTCKELVFNNFGDWLRRRDCSDATVKHYLSDLRQFVAWFEERTGDEFALDAVAEYDVNGWRDHLAAKCKPSTVNRKLAALRSLFRWAGETEQVGRDPTAYVNGLAQQPTAPKGLSEQDLTRILRQAALSGNLRDHALLEMLAATGLRVSEIAALQMRDLDLGERHGWVRVRAPDAKRRKERRVPVKVDARRVLQEYLDSRTVGAQGIAANDPIFLSQKGGAMTPYAVWYKVKKYARLAGVEEVSPHNFRHTVATRLVRDSETDMVTAAAFLGHSRLDTTARYSQPSEEDLAAAAERLGS